MSVDDETKLTWIWRTVILAILIPGMGSAMLMIGNLREAVARIDERIQTVQEKVNNPPWHLESDGLTNAERISKIEKEIEELHPRVSLQGNSNQ